MQGVLQPLPCPAPVPRGGGVLFVQPPSVTAASGSLTVSTLPESRGSRLSQKRARRVCSAEG
jgi:hypothetical protein